MFLDLKVDLLTMEQTLGHHPDRAPLWHDDLRRYAVGSIRADYETSAKLSLLLTCVQINEEARLVVPICQTLICAPGRIHVGEHLNAVFGTLLDSASSLHNIIPRMDDLTTIVQILHAAFL